MLEQALNNSEGSPSETSRALSSFFRQEFPLGGTAAEARFVHFFSLLVERVFGPLVPNCLSPEHEFTVEQLKLIGAAWLMHTRPWTSRSSNSEASVLPYSNAPVAPRLESDPVIQLLSTPNDTTTQKTTGKRSESLEQTSGRALSFFQILTNQSDLEMHIVRNAQSSFPFTELPRNFQQALIHLVGTASSIDKTQSFSLNSPQKLIDCFCINPLQQKEFVFMVRQIMSRSPHGYERGAAIRAQHSIPGSSNMQSPSIPAGQGMIQSFSPSSAPAQDVVTMKQNLLLNLTLCEYYFMVFCRFPLVSGKINQVNKRSSSGTSARSRSVSYPFGEKVYSHLLRDYIKYYFPHDYNRGDKAYDSLDSSPGGRRYEMKDLFLRLMIGYWFEKHVYSETSDVMSQLSLKKAGLESSYDLAQLLPTADVWRSRHELKSKQSQNYEAPPKQAQRAIKILVEHIVCDPSIIRYCRDIGKLEETKQSSSIDQVGWQTSLARYTLQPSLYNYIRTGLRYGPIHVSRSSFYATMDLWLMWLEPWNVQCKKSSGATMQAKELFHNVTNLSSPKRTSNSARQKVQQISQYATPKPNQASKYTDLWKPYVAANLHFYLVPFAIFIRRAREFDFTRGDFQRSMDHLTRVIRVFTPKLVSTLDLLLEDTEENSTLGNIMKRHEEALGLFCPPCFGEGRKEFNLKMLQEEMHNLLEEITIQHEKTVGEQYFIERMFSKIEGVFGSKAEEIVISKLVQKAKVIVKFPQDYEVVPSPTRKNGLFRKPSVFDKSSAINNDSPERESNGIISEKGREQLLHGSRLCNPIDVKFLGDPMYARPKSHEIDFLVKWALKLSNKLNVYFHLDVPQESKLYGINTNMTAEQLAMEERNMTKVGLFRFNLRFIADKRNWIMIFFIWKILRWIIIG